MLRAGGTIGRIAWWRDLKVRQFDRMRRPARRWRGWRWLHPKGGSMPAPPEHDNRRGKTHLVSLSAAGAARAPWHVHLLSALARRRPEDRRVGKEGVRTGSHGGLP